MQRKIVIKIEAGTSATLRKQYREDDAEWLEVERQAAARRMPAKDEEPLFYNPHTLQEEEDADPKVGRVEEWACNKYGCGLWYRNARGDWRQEKGTGDTPCFGAPWELLEYLQEREKSSGYKLVLIDSVGWPE